MSAKLALEKYSRRNSGIKRQRQKNEKNQSPEKEVEREVIEWCEKRRFDVSVVESKAVFSRSAGRYLRGQTEAGFADVAGCTDEGIGFFVELKARGRRNTIRPAQVEFLLRKIRLGAFGACVDSADSLNDFYITWSVLRKESVQKSIEYLISILPKSNQKEYTDDIPW